jgi:hypothetical protein
MRKFIAIIVFALLFTVSPVFAASESFTATSAITVSSVQGDGLTADFTILNGSTAASWTINSTTGAFSATTDSSSDFKVSASSNTVVAIGYYSGSTGTCTPNTKPGTTYAEITSSAGTYTIAPYTTTSCCDAVTYVSTYNAYPTCGPASCQIGYQVSGSSCVLIGGGGAPAPAGGGGGGYVAPSLPYPNGTLLRAINTQKVYVIDQNKKRWIPTGEIFTGNGYVWSNIRVVDPSILTQYADGADIQMAVSPAPSGTPTPSPSPNPSLPDGALIRANGGIDVYIVKYMGTKMFKRLILSPSVFNSYQHLKWSNVMDVDQSVLDSFTTSNLVRAVNDPKVYELYPAGDTGQKRWIETADVFTRLGLDWDSVYEINQVDRDSYVTGDPLE